MERDILLFFNLELDLDSLVLAAAHEWVHEFSAHFSQTLVFSTHVGRTNLSESVKVRELGGGSTKQRIKAILILLRLIPYIFRNRNRIVAFHHMSPRTAIIVGWFIRFVGIPQGLWYSHSHASREFKLASHIANLLFSTSPLTLPIDSKKARFVGHGIQSRNFIQWRESNINRDKTLVSIGRLVRIKRFEIGINELTKSSSAQKKFEIFGPGNHASEYASYLKSKSTNSGVDLILHGALPYDAIPEILASSRFFVSGTPKSVDKAALEAAMSGCFIISDNPETLKLSGMKIVIDWIQSSTKEETISLIDSINKLPPHEVDFLRLEVSKIAETSHDVRKLAIRVTNELKGA